MNKLYLKIIIFQFVVSLFFSVSVLRALPSSRRIGIVISQTSVNTEWEIAQMSAFAWTAIANIAGIPYECLLLENMAQVDLSKYNLLIFGQCRSIHAKDYAASVALINGYLHSKSCFKNSYTLRLFG